MTPQAEPELLPEDYQNAYGEYLTKLTNGTNYMHVKNLSHKADVAIRHALTRAAQPPTPDSEVTSAEAHKWFIKYCEVMEKIDDMCSFHGSKGVSEQSFQGEKVEADLQPKLAIELAFNEAVAAIRKDERGK